MRVYETTFIINPQTDDATIDRQVKDVADIITTTNGRIMHTDHMGTRRMAYAINGLTQGYYASFIFEAPTEVLPKMERHFKLNEQYLRHLTVVYEGDVVDGVVQPPVDIFSRREPGRDRGRHDSRPGAGERADRGPVEKAPSAKEAPAPAEKAPVAEETSAEKAPVAEETPAPAETPVETAAVEAPAKVEEPAPVEEPKSEAPVDEEEEL